MSDDMKKTLDDIRKKTLKASRELGETDEQRWNPEWVEYYQYLEELRASGVTNMYGAVPYLQEVYGHDDDFNAHAVLGSWMKYYSVLVAEGVIERGGE